MGPDDAVFTGPMLSQQLLLSLAEQLKQPLVTIARQAELEAGMEQPSSAMAAIRSTAEVALQLMDNYLIGVRLAGAEPAFIHTEPVSVSAVLRDTSEQLQPFAKTYGVTLDLHIDGKYGPVMAHRRALQAALVSLGYALVEALPAQQESNLQLRLSAYRCRYGIVAGLYCDMRQLTAQTLQVGRRLQGKARQPMNVWSHSSAAGVYVADAILRAMRVRLTATRHRRQYGLGTVLPLNPQLQFV